MNSRLACILVALATGGVLLLAACSSSTAPKDPGASYDLSAQAYGDGVHVYARRDDFGDDAGVEPEFSASIGDATQFMGYAAASPDRAAEFPVIAGAFTAQISGSQGTLATIDVPAALDATLEQNVLHPGDHLKLTLSPAPGDGSKVTLRAMQQACLFVLFDDVTTKPSSVEGAAAEFDMKTYFDAMLQHECDASFGVRYETTGHMGDGFVGKASGLREVSVTVHLVNPNAPILGPSDAGVVADAGAG
jgi:hypothetical protein